MIFQDPISSLNPRRKVKDIVAEGLTIWGTGIGSRPPGRVNEVLDAVGLDPADRRRPPAAPVLRRAVPTHLHRQGVVLEPKVLICDEPVSALDVSVQAQILNLLEDMKARYELTMMFIAHDLAVVKNISDRVIVMYLGKICEVADARRAVHAPAAPLHEGAARLDPPARPSPAADQRTRSPASCRRRSTRRRDAGSAPAAPAAAERCALEEPQIRESRPGHFVACHYPLGAPESAAS